MGWEFQSFKTNPVYQSAGSETRTRTTAKSLVFETIASTIPPFPRGAQT